MRRILVDKARRKQTAKARRRTPAGSTSSDVQLAWRTDGDDLLALDEALGAASERPAQGRAGQAALLRRADRSTQAAAALGVSPADRRADWAYARGWLGSPSIA